MITASSELSVSLKGPTIHMGTVGGTRRFRWWGVLHFSPESVWNNTQSC